MKTITLRNVPDSIARKIEERARTTGKSYNRTVIDILEEAVGESKPRIYRDLDHLAGTWTKEEADEFDEFLRQHRKIDWEMWK